MHQNELKQLLSKYLSGQTTAAEQQQLSEWIGESSEREHVADILTEMALNQPYDPWFDESRFMPLFHAITRADKIVNSSHTPNITRRLRWVWAAAAAVLLLTATSLYFLVQKQPHTPSATLHTTTDVQPGKGGAILTLSDGRNISLDSLQGQVAVEQGAYIHMQNGMLSYETTGHSTSNTVYNSVTTPRGRQFHLTLPDGTAVWLNAASSIKYPAAFKGSERRVSITGEAYFEVAANSKQPFIVQTGALAVQVLGTSFNINSYTDEPGIKTTLAEGLIKVNAGNQSQLVQPQQQVVFTHGKLQLPQQADISATLAWKNGRFHFTDADLPAVMRQLSRWYNVEVIYKGSIPAGEFNGKIENTLTLNQVLKGLGQTIKYKIENGNRIIIENNQDQP